MKYILFITLLFTDLASADLTVLFDNDQTHDLPAAPAAVPARRPAASAPRDNPLLPIHTPELSVGRVTKRKTPVLAYALRPTCVIGSDPESLSWLQQNKKQLMTVNAYCWLVQADTPDDLQRVANIAKGLMVVPVPGTILRQAFGIEHYPVLISSRWIEQ